MYVLVAILFYLAVPSLQKTYTNNIFLENRSIIDQMRALNINKPVDILEMEGGFSTYLGDNYTWYEAYDKNISFNKMLVEKNINMIVVSDKLLDNLKYSEDAEWQQFLGNFEKYGFYKHYLHSRIFRYLLIKKDLI